MVLQDGSCIVIAEIYEVGGGAGNYHNLFKLYKVSEGKVINTLDILNTTGSSYYVNGKLINAGDEVGFFIENSYTENPPHLILYRVDNDLGIKGIHPIDIAGYYLYSYMSSNPVYNNKLNAYQLILSGLTKTSEVHLLQVDKFGNCQFLKKDLNNKYELDKVEFLYDPKVEEYLLLFQDGEGLNSVWFKSADSKLNAVKLSDQINLGRDISLSPKYYVYGLRDIGCTVPPDAVSFYTVSRIYLDKFKMKKTPIQKIPKIPY